MGDYFFRNKTIRGLSDYLKDRLCLDDESVAYSSSPNEKYVEALQRMDNLEKKLIAFYSSSITYEADEGKAAVFEALKGNLDLERVNGFFGVCKRVEAPLEKLTLIIERDGKKENILDLRMNPYATDHYLVIDDEKIEDSSQIFDLVEAKLGEYDL